MTTTAHRVERAVTDGIERVSVFPRKRRFAPPIVMQHGMWHGAWCWRPWQELLAGFGWESHAHSLPGHGSSPMQRPIRWCTLGYYARFLAAEMDRHETRPVLMGHSMGGALTQWYLKKFADDLPAAILVAPWPAWAIMPTVVGHARLDPVGVALTALTLNATPAMRNPQVAARALITEGATMTPEELHARLGPESFLVLAQYNPPLWRPAVRVQTPMLWIAGGADAFFPVGPQRRSAEHYGADFALVENEGHNLMMESSWRSTVEAVHRWLSAHLVDSRPREGRAVEGTS